MLIAQAQRETYLQCQASLTIGRDKVCLGHSQYFLGENFKRVDVPGQGAHAGGHSVERCQGLVCNFYGQL